MQGKLVVYFFLLLFFFFLSSPPFFSTFSSIPLHEVLIVYLLHVYSGFVVVYKIVNAAYILLSGQMSDALLINIYHSGYLCSGCMTFVSEACLMMISFLLSVYHLGYSWERRVWEASLLQSLCVEITALSYLCFSSSLFLCLSLSPAGVNDCSCLPEQDNLLSQLESPADSCLAFSWWKTATKHWMEERGAATILAAAAAAAARASKDSIVPWC